MEAGCDAAVPAGAQPSKRNGRLTGRPTKEKEVTLMRPCTRLQDWGTLLAGLYAALSPIWVSTTGERDAFWALIVLGALLAVTALCSLALPGVVATEWLAMLFGVLLFAAPWVLTYTDRVGASWTSWVVGAIAVVLGAITVGTGNRRRPQVIQP
jgi:SPW repeat